MRLSSFALLLGTSVYAAVPMEDVIEIMRGKPSEGGCSPDQTSRLKAMWAQMQEATWTTYQLLETQTSVKKGIPVALAHTLWSFMGVRNQQLQLSEFADKAERQFSKAVAKGGVEKLTTLRSFFRSVFEELTTDTSRGSPLKKRQLYCDSIVLQFVGPDADIIRFGSEKDRHRRRVTPLSREKWYDKTQWYWRLPTLRGGAGILAEDPGTAHPARDQREGSAKPKTFCSDPTRLAWSIAGSQFERPNAKTKGSAPNDVIILCPNFFIRKPEDPKNPLKDKTDPDVWDFGPEARFPPGYQLDWTRPKWLTLYRALMWLRMTYSFKRTKIVTWTEQKIKLDRPPQKNMIKQGLWETGQAEAQSPKDCMNIAEYDVTPELSTPADSLAIRSPQNASWFVLALYLWIASPDHQDWSTGIAVDASEGGKIPDIAPAPDTLPKTLPKTEKGKGAKRKHPDDPEATGEDPRKSHDEAGGDPSAGQEPEGEEPSEHPSNLSPQFPYGQPFQGPHDDPFQDRYDGSIYNPLEDPNYEPLDPNYEPLDPNYHPLDPNYHPFDPNYHALDPNYDPLDPNYNPLDPNYHPLDPNYDPLDPNYNPFDPMYNPLDDPNYEPFDPNYNPVDPNYNPYDPNYNPYDPTYNPFDEPIHDPHDNPNEDPQEGSSRIPHERLRQDPPEGPRQDPHEGSRQDPHNEPHHGSDHESEYGPGKSKGKGRATD